MKMTENDIQTLVAHVLDGTSTRKEEKLLAEYFNTHDVVKPEWEDCKLLFDYIAAGMPDISEVETVKQTSTLRKKALRITAGVVAVAASLVLLFTVLPSKEEKGFVKSKNQEKLLSMPLRENFGETNKEQYAETAKSSKTKTVAIASKQDAVAERGIIEQSITQEQSVEETDTAAEIQLDQMLAEIASQQNEAMDLAKQMSSPDRYIVEHEKW